MELNMDDALKRPALYYPYIHIRSEHWLKATLLCVPAVTRIVPEDYIPEDDPSIITYTRIAGPNGELLQTVPSFSPSAEEAQFRLLVKLREHEADVVARFRRDIAGPDTYWIHVAKFNRDLLDYLLQNNLAWYSLHSAAYGHREWYALHPTLGSAIMTTLGLSIARERHYDIVTPSTEYHETLLATKEDEIFDTLLGAEMPQPTLTKSQARHDLAQFVITMTGINYEALRPDDIPELQASKHFRNFQQLVRAKAPTFDHDDDAEDYEEQLEYKAEGIIDAWHETKNDLSGTLKDALFEQGLVLSGEALKAQIKGADISDLVIAGGIAIALLLRKGLRFREAQQHGNPYQYLTQIEQAQSEFLRMTCPLGLER